MSIINLFWNLNVTDTTKYLMIIAFFIGILLLCFFNGMKPDKKKNKKSECQQKYIKCMKTNIKNNKNDFCYPCLDDGSSPDFFFDPQKNEWIKKN